MNPPTVANQSCFGSVFNWRNLGLLRRGEILSAALGWWREHGDVVRIRVGHHWIYLIARPEDISYVLVENYKNFSKETPSFKGLQAYLGHGLLSVHDHGKWSRNRKIVQPLFQKDQILRQMPVFLRKAEALTNGLACLLEDELFDLGAIMTSLTLGVLGESVLNCELEDESSQINKSIHEAFNYTTSRMYNPFAPPGYVPTPQNVSFYRAKRRLRKLVREIVKNQSASAGKNLFSVFAEASASVPVSEPEIFDEFVTMIQAGHETTANALNWLFCRLHENPEVLARVREEVRDDAKFASYQTMETSSYLHQVIQESMRLDPAAWGFDRRTVSADRVGGFPVSKGDFILISPYITHRHPEYWPDPEIFDPSRFEPEKIKARPKMAYIPFGGGPRVCIAQLFALVEMKVIVATLLRRGRIEILNADKVHREPSVTLRPTVPIIARYRPDSA